MSSIGWDEFHNKVKYATENAPEHSNSIYGIVMSGVGDNDITAVRKYLKRKQKNNPYLIWYLVDSNTKPKYYSNISYPLKTIEDDKPKRKRGRPSHKTPGRKVPRHIHVVLCHCVADVDTAEEKDNFCDFLRKRRKKNPNLKQYKSQFIYGFDYFVEYCFRQANHIYTDGEFDWDYFIGNEYYYDGRYDRHIDAKRYKKIVPAEGEEIPKAFLVDPRENDHFHKLK